MSIWQHWEDTAIIPRQPVAGENPRRIFVGIIDDTIGGIYFPTSRPIVRNMELSGLIFHGRWLVDDLSVFSEAVERLIFFRQEGTD